MCAVPSAPWAVAVRVWEAPRSQAARSADAQKATSQVKDAEAASKAGKKHSAAEKTEAAMEMLKK